MSKVNSLQQQLETYVGNRAIWRFKILGEESVEFDTRNVGYSVASNAYILEGKDEDGILHHAMIYLNAHDTFTLNYESYTFHQNQKQVLLQAEVWYDESQKCYMLGQSGPVEVEMHIICTCILKFT